MVGAMDKQLSKDCIKLLLLTILVWAALFWEGIFTAFEIWWGNEIFNHCLFVIPTSAYLIYQKRAVLLSKTLKPTLIPLLFIIPLCILYVLGTVGDIQIAMHVSAFTLIPLLIWAVIGHGAAKSILFPLAFILFSIPIGEQLIPHLQKITADGSVALLNSVGVPLYRNGLYIEIPAGRFLVAEACSGVSFFIVSIVIGSLFSYLSFVSSTKKIIFVGISVVLPIVANIIRVFGIIYIAHKTNMEYAAGADHLIYGWFFFAFVLICLLGIGELIRDKSIPSTKNAELSYGCICSDNKKLLTTYTILLAFGIWGWSYSTFQPKIVDSALGSKKVDGAFECTEHSAFWRPKIVNADRAVRSQYNIGNKCNLVLVQADSFLLDTEMVSGLNLLYTEKEWSLVKTEIETLSIDNHRYRLPFLYLTSPSGNTIKVAKWYEVNNLMLASDIKAKLYTTYLKMTYQYKGGRLLVLGVPTSLNTSTLNVIENDE